MLSKKLYIFTNVYFLMCVILTEFVGLHRIRFGSNNLFVFINPEEAEKMKRKGKQLMDITYEYAQNEIAKHSGLNLEDGTLKIFGFFCHDKLIDCLESKIDQLSKRADTID